MSRKRGVFMRVKKFHSLRDPRAGASYEDPLLSMRHVTYALENFSNPPVVYPRIFNYGTT